MTTRGPELKLGLEQNLQKAGQLGTNISSGYQITGSTFLYIVTVTKNTFHVPEEIQQPSHGQAEGSGCQTPRWEWSHVGQELKGIETCGYAEITVPLMTGAIKIRALSGMLC